MVSLALLNRPSLTICPTFHMSVFFVEVTETHRSPFCPLLISAIAHPPHTPLQSCNWIFWGLKCWARAFKKSLPPHRRVRTKYDALSCPLWSPWSLMQFLEHPGCLTAKWWLIKIPRFRVTLGLHCDSYDVFIRFLLMPNFQENEG